MDRAQKQAEIEELDLAFSESGVVVISHYVGLTVAQMSELRAQMRNVGARAKVAKNTLARRAFEGKPGAGAAQYLKGQTLLAFSEDPVAAAKVVVEFSKKHEKLVVLGGAMGATVLNADGVKALAELPSLDQLRGGLIGLLQAPASKLARVVQAPAGQLARVFAAYSEKDAA
ncbi:50S ribosomal protein L10 [Neomegalonema sp.]|uniref:50S ribosomal protein L10 n=1 Tax=Neomegalonema sp. TaxID=2039713 RepID=UPI0026261886|nr:50S ribosomal protein L10 [Neomegalonema sp.]MDD2867008.1 50S ribosomal protein L10 [Neomegalonema sp.]